MQVVTPDILYQTADSLVGYEYMCVQFGRVIGVSPVSYDRVLFSEFILDAGCPTLSGDLQMSNREYIDTAKEVRFMFLEFLALYLETQDD